MGVGPSMTRHLCWTWALCLLWKQALGPSELWEISAGSIRENPTHQSPPATAWLWRTHLPCKSWPPWACELWHSIQAELAHIPSCLLGWLTECSQYIFPFLAASCSYWLPHSLFGTTQHSCTNAVAWTDVQLCIESCRKAENAVYHEAEGWGSVTSTRTPDMDPYHFLPLATY